MAKIDKIVTVTNAGTKVALGGANDDLLFLQVIGHEDNQGLVHVAFSNVSSGTGLGAPLGPQDSFWLGANELRDLELGDWYVDAVNSGDKLVVIAITKD